MRFPEFTGEWEKKQLQEECSFFSGGTPSSSNKEYYDGDIPFIRSGEIDAQHTELFLTQKGYNNSSAKMVEIGDLLLALYGATSGEIAINKIHGAINQAILCIRSPYNNVFVKSIWKKHVLHILQTYLQGGQGNLSADIVKKLSFYFPSNREQDKISEFVALVDQRIETQNKIIEDLKTLKSAISAKLLHNSCWNDMKIHEICHTLNYKQYIAKNIQETGEFPVIQQGDNPICGYSHETPFDNYKNVLLFGDHTLSLYKPNSKFLLATDGIKVLLPTGHIKRDFLYYLLEANMPKSEGYKRHYSILKEVNVKVPPIEEQEKISGVFIAIDDKIALEQLLKSSYKTQKAFLLQQMFI